MSPSKPDKKKDQYAEAGVNIEAGNRFVELIKPIVSKTQTPGVITNIGGFAGLFRFLFNTSTILSWSAPPMGSAQNSKLLSCSINMIRWDWILWPCVSTISWYKAHLHFFSSTTFP